MRIKRWLLLIPIIAGTAAAEAEVVDDYLTSPLARAFGTSPTIGRPRLSPDASKLLFLQALPENGDILANVLDFATGERSQLVRGAEQFNLDWCEWANETRILCSNGIGVNIDGTQPLRRMRPGAGCSIMPGITTQQRLLNWLPQEPQYVSDCGGSVRINVYTGGREDIEVGERVEGILFTDGYGFSALQRRDEKNLERWYSRDDYGSEWQLLHESEPRNFEDPFWPIGFDQTTQLLFHLEWDSGRWGLSALDRSNDYQNIPIFRHPLFDIWLVDTLGPYSRVAAAAFLDGRPQRYVVDERIASVYQAAFSALPDHNVEVINESWDGNSYLVLARPPGRAGTYYMIDMWEDTILLIGPEHPQLADVELAETRSISFATPDGGIVSGHLTLPNGSQGPLPTVIIPRAVPSFLDISDPHYLVQFLAASGYAVLRVNYRSDEQFGSWLPGRVRLGWRRVISDMQSAIRYLLDEEIAVEGRICALGRNIGAYVGILTALEHPSEVACLVSIGGEIQGAGGAGGSGLIDASVREDIRDNGNPQRRARELDTPIIMFHGVYGSSSSLGATRDFNRQLEAADKDVLFFEYEFGNQEIEREPYRIDMLTRIGSFLEEHIGAD